MWLGQPELKATWVNSSSLPPSIVEKYENQEAVEVIAVTNSQYGQVSSTLSVDDCKKSSKPSKKRKKERSIISTSEGYGNNILWYIYFMGFKSCLHANFLSCNNGPYIKSHNFLVRASNLLCTCTIQAMGHIDISSVS